MMVIVMFDALPCVRLPNPGNLEGMEIGNLTHGMPAPQLPNPGDLQGMVIGN